METRKEDERYYSVRILGNLPISEQIHQANALICTEASENESVFLERLEKQNGHIVLLYRLWCRKDGKKEIKAGAAEKTVKLNKQVG